jgi:tetratricopeptide (TPR) repeat protein
MTTTTDLLAAGWRCHQGGDLVRAEQAYRQVLQQEADNAQVWFLLGLLGQSHGDLNAAAASLDQALRLQPGHADAVHLRGVVYAQQGQFAEAAAKFRTALQLKPNDAEIQTNLALVLTDQGKYAESVALLQEVLRSRPDYGPAQTHLREALAQQAVTEGLVYLQEGKLEEAAAYLRQSLRSRADVPYVHYNLGYTLSRLERWDEAIASYQEALRLEPQFVEAHRNLGIALRRKKRSVEAEVHCRVAVQLRPEMPEVHHELALALLEQKRLAEPEASCREAIRLRPEFAEAHQLLGLALLRQDRVVEARESLGRAVQLEPNVAQAQNYLGIALWRLGCLEEAEISLREALRLRPDYAEAFNNLATVLRDLGPFEEALENYASALSAKPDYADPHWNAALVWLLLGDFEKGWPENEWRRQRSDFPSRVFVQPRWDGSPLAGRTILLYAEQGLGDTIQFMRYASLLRDQGATVILECQRPLLGLLRRCRSIDFVVGQGDPLPAHDVCALLLDLPDRFRTTVATIPAQVPYLWADPVLVEQWHRAMACHAGFKVGIAWQGSPMYRSDKERSIPLMEFAPLAEVPGVRLVSLQKGPGSEQLAALAGHWSVTDLGSRLDESGGAFMDTAAVMKHLDLVVTVDTAIAHLAGALGVAVWVLLPTVPHWPWLLDRDDSPWYPTARLFRQQRRGEWGPVLQRVVQAVRQEMLS